MKNLLLSWFEDIDFGSTFGSIFKSIIDYPIIWAIVIGILWQITTLTGIGNPMNPWGFGNILFAIIAGTIIFQAIFGLISFEWKESIEHTGVFCAAWLFYKLTALPILLFMTDTTFASGAELYAWILNPWLIILGVTIFFGIVKAVIIFGSDFPVRKRNGMNF